jgi:hypothetical protein
VEDEPDPLPKLPQLELPNPRLKPLDKELEAATVIAVE